MSLRPEEKEALAAMLGPAALEDNREACEACIALLESGCVEPRLQDLAVSRLRTIAHRKYRPEFLEAAGRLERLAGRRGLERLAAKVAAVEELFSARIAAQS
jgi:hypothetical protein